jgi:DNA-binding NtrC family response regulator
MNVSGSTILILEDEPIIGLALEDMLADRGASVLFASGIEEAQDLVAAKTINSAILDVNVHGARSYGVAEALAARKIPFVFATGYGDRAHPPEFAAIPTISKPYSFDDIAAALTTASLQGVG